MSEEPVKVIFRRYGVDKPHPPPPAPSIVRVIGGRPPDAEEPPMGEKIKRAWKAFNQWKDSGYKLVPSKVRKERMAVCRTCEYFNPKGNGGLGMCMAPGCGCSNIRAALATYKCPKGKWKE